MGTIVVVTSGKGGVGKTTSTAALGAALAHDGQNVVVVDFDVGLRNLDLIMGAERRVVFDLINVVQGDAKLAQALIRDKRLDTLSLLPASQTRDKDALTEEGVGRVMGELQEKFDWVICDSPAGIERGATLAMRHADTAIVVTNPEVSSVREFRSKSLAYSDSKTKKVETGGRIDKHLLLTRYDSARAERGEMLKVDDVLEILSIPLLGIIPESQEVIRASNLGSPVTLNNANSAPARAYLAAAKRLKGDELPANDRRRSPGTALLEESCMKLLSFFRQPATAAVARERLQLLLAHERASLGGRSELLEILRTEILQVIAKHVAVDKDKVKVIVGSLDEVATLEVNIEIRAPSAFEEGVKKVA